MPSPDSLIASEIDRRGARLFASWLASGHDAGQEGRFLVFDIVSGDLQLGDSDLEATDLLIERRPNGVFWGTRVGEAAYNLRAGMMSPRW